MAESALIAICKYVAHVSTLSQFPSMATNRPPLLLLSNFTTANMMNARFNIITEKSKASSDSNAKSPSLKLLPLLHTRSWGRCVRNDSYYSFIVLFGRMRCRVAMIDQGDPVIDHLKSALFRLVTWSSMKTCARSEPLFGTSTTKLSSSDYSILP